MATNQRKFFESDSEDSIATASTAKSELQDHYLVQEILLEGETADGEKEYLIRWATYPLHRATWERESQINSDELLQEWATQKAAIARGAAQPFDENEFNQAFEDHETARDSRKARRKKKRQRRGIPVSPDDTHGESEPEPPPAKKNTKTPKQAPVKRKGVAQKLSRRQYDSEESSFSESGTSKPSDGDSDADSMYEELKQKAEAEKEKQAVSKKVRNDSDAFKQPKPSAKPQQSRQPASSVASKATLSKAAPPKPGPTKPAPSTLARKTAPTSTSSGATGSAQPKNVFANWADSPVKRKQRARVSGETPKDSDAPQFHKLSLQGRMQKYSRNEKAPNPELLNFIDPKTGAPLPRTSEPRETEMQTKHTQQSSTAVPPAYHRRTPPPSRPERSPTPPSPPRRNSDVRAGTMPAAQTADMLRRKNGTCRHWLQGHCDYGPDVCRNAHYVVDHKSLTCFFWHIHGKCKRSEAECDFAHHFTGTVAHPPAGYSFDSAQTVAQPKASIVAGPDPTVAARPESFVVAGLNPPPPSRTEYVRRKSLTCFFWHTHGKCKRSEAECDFAHRFTGTVADPPVGYSFDSVEPPVVPQLRSSVVAGPDLLAVARPGSSVKARPESAVIARPDLSVTAGSNPPPARSEPILLTTVEEASRYPRAEVTCHFWRTTTAGCTRDNCKYAHFDTGIYAPPPGTLRKASKSADVMGPNRLPLGANVRGRIDTNVSASSHSPRATFSTGNTQSHAITNSPVQVTQSPIHQTQQTPDSGFNIRGAAQQRQPSIMDGTLVLHFGGDDAQSVPMKMEISDIAGFHRLAGSDHVTLQTKQLVMASDFEHVVRINGDIMKGSVFGGISLDRSQAAWSEKIASMCKSHSAALVAVPRGFDSQMLIYPIMADEFKYLDAGGTGVSSLSTLHFRLFKTSLGASPNSDAPSVADDRATDQLPEVSIGQHLAGLDLHRLFPPAMKDPRKPAHELKQPEKAVFLMFPPKYAAELKVYTRFFEAIPSKVYHSGVKGAWDYFLKKYSGSSYLVVVHPKVHLSLVPGLHDFVAGSGGSIFSIGINRRVCMLEEKKVVFGCERLFPRGVVIYITDDMFIYHPEKARQVIDAYLEVHKHKKAGMEQNRIVTRPGVKDWLLEVAVNSNRDPRFFALLDSICKLIPYEVEHIPEYGGTFVPSDRLHECPEYMEHFHDMWLKNEVAATNYMAEWFAGWAVMNAHRHRVFVICHEEKPGSVPLDKSWKADPDPRGWSKKWHHVGVGPPSKAIAHLRPRVRR